MPFKSFPPLSNRPTESSFPTRIPLAYPSDSGPCSPLCTYTPLQMPPCTGIGTYAVVLRTTQQSLAIRNGRTPTCLGLKPAADEGCPLDAVEEEYGLDVVGRKSLFRGPAAY
ncbi:hypothetical protein FA13DRAFT_299055 [Coprinellus micaceus]|uniref:Uncharacterized protein n=1 Tax=Coprinellus micaceus TaxID=71717 RepID=A0A4Y7SDT1_COPMI|nr:hypothetical protein FA13DRAFT_299055 [Coprinellus micaceus]